MKNLARPCFDPSGLDLLFIGPRILLAAHTQRECARKKITLTPTSRSVVTVLVAKAATNTRRNRLYDRLYRTNAVQCRQRRDDDGFPTPVGLMAAQRQYAKAKKQQRRSDGEVPEPFPPPTLKAEIYNVADYADVDAHAGKV